MCDKIYDKNLTCRSLEKTKKAADFEQPQFVQTA